MDTINIYFEGINHTYPKGTLAYDISKDSKLSNIMGYKINNEVYSLDEKLNKDSNIEFINTNDIIGNKIYKAGLKFLFQVALKETFPTLEVSFEHSLPIGMLTKINGDKILTNSDISLIKNSMYKLIENNNIITKINIIPKEAIKYYKQHNEYEKLENVQNISDRVVNLYKLKNEINYFYSIMPYSTESINKFEIIYLGNNVLALLFPTKDSNGNVPEYVHYANIIDCFKKEKEWLLKEHTPYISNINTLVGTDKIKDFISSCELMFYLKLIEVVNTIKLKPDIKFILIAGPSSSGKTTTMKRLSNVFKSLGYDTVNVSLDDYFVNRENTPKDKDGKYDFESLAAIRVNDFNKDLKKLLDGEEINLPKYDFLTGRGELSKDKVKLKENSIILVEGLHAINDELTEEIEDKYKYKVYLSPFMPLSIDRHNYISSLDLRLLRRIVRDDRTRGYSVTDTIKAWQLVRRGEEKNIFPFIHQADTIINTSLPYEMGVLKVYVEPLLYSVSIDSEYYEEARRLISCLKQFFPIPGEYVNEDSILREFIGGGRYND